MRIAVCGLGYVGSVSAACLARDSHDVVGVDIDPAKVAMIDRGQAPVEEPGLAQLLAEQRHEQCLTATTDLEPAIRGTDLAVIAVGTPSQADGSVRVDAAVAVMRQIGRALAGTDQPYLVVVRSTLLPGILEEQLIPELEDALDEPVGGRVRICNHPEFLRETTALKDYDHPPFIIVGTDDDEVARTVFSLYDGIEAERIQTDTRSAAMIKYACNAFHALKVDFANEIGVLAKAMGADGQEVMKIVCRDRQLNISPAYLRPGFAFGGSCLPKDVRALSRFAQQHAIHTRLIDSILPSNQAHLERALDDIRGHDVRRIGMIGLSFKAGTDDLRESPQVWLAEQLIGRGYQLKIYDPVVQVSRLVGRNQAFVDRHLPHLASLLVDRPEEISDAELLVLATDVADEHDWHATFAGPVFDLRCDLVRPNHEPISSRAP